MMKEDVEQKVGRREVERKREESDRVVVLVSTSRSRDDLKTCQCLVSVSAIYVSYLRHISGQILEVRIIILINSVITIKSQYHVNSGNIIMITSHYSNLLHCDNKFYLLAELSIAYLL